MHMAIEVAWPTLAGLLSIMRDPSRFQRKQTIGCSVAYYTAGIRLQEHSIVRQLWRGLTQAWCRLMHPDPMWPCHGYYRRPTCLREYPVSWANSPPMPADGEVGTAMALRSTPAIGGRVARPARPWRAESKRA